MLSPGFVSYQVVTFVAPCQPGSERSPSTTIAPEALVIGIGLPFSGGAALAAMAAPKRPVNSHIRTPSWWDTVSLDVTFSKKFGVPEGRGRPDHPEIGKPDPSAAFTAH